MMKVTLKIMSMNFMMVIYYKIYIELIYLYSINFLYKIYLLFIFIKIITRKVIEKFLNFHYEILHYCLNNLNKIANQNISKDNMEFTYFYLAIAFFQHPQFRTAFVKYLIYL